MKEEGEGDPKHWLPHGTPIVDNDPRLARRDIVRDGSQLRVRDGSALGRLLDARVIDECHYHTGRQFQQMRHCSVSPLEAHTGGRPPGSPESSMDGFDYFRVRRLIPRRALPYIEKACFSRLTADDAKALYDRRGNYQEAFELLQQAIHDRGREKRDAKKHRGLRKIYVEQLGRLCDIDPA